MLPVVVVGEGRKQVEGVEGVVGPGRRRKAVDADTDPSSRSGARCILVITNERLVTL